MSTQTVSDSTNSVKTQNLPSAEKFVQWLIALDKAVKACPHSIFFLAEQLEEKIRSIPRVLSQGPLYLNSNEKHQQKTLYALTKQPLCGNAIIATSGLFALDIVAHRLQAPSTEKYATIKHIILFDLSTRVVAFWQKMKRIIGESSSKEECFQKIENDIFDYAPYYMEHFKCSDPSSTLLEACQMSVNQLAHAIFAKTSWLSSDESFQRIQAIFLQKQFAVLSLHLADALSFKSLNKELKLNDIVVDTMYFSNIIEMAKGRSNEATQTLHNLMVKSIESVTHSDTLLVDAETHTASGFPEQRVRRQGHTPLSP